MPIWQSLAGSYLLGSAACDKAVSSSHLAAARSHKLQEQADLHMIMPHDPALQGLHLVCVQRDCLCPELGFIAGQRRRAVALFIQAGTMPSSRCSILGLDRILNCSERVQGHSGNVDEKEFGTIWKLCKVCRPLILSQH